MNLFDISKSINEVEISGKKAIIDMLSIGFDAEKCAGKEHILEPKTGFQSCDRCNSMFSVVIYND